MIHAEVLLDSQANGKRLTTMVLEYPRFIHAQLMTHRVFSRNAQSSRAVPTKTLLERVSKRPVVPMEWGRNQPGMQAETVLEGADLHRAQGIWASAAEEAARSATRLMVLGVHKQIVNRLLEPFTTITVLVTATEWDNFWKLRCHPHAQPEMEALANAMKRAYDMSVPIVWRYPRTGPGGLAPWWSSREAHSEIPIPAPERHITPPPGYRATLGPVPPLWGWHAPFLKPDDLAAGLPLDKLLLVSAARCARVSYLSHDGTRDLDKDIQLGMRLWKDGHLSPFEHVARPLSFEEQWAEEHGPSRRRVQTNLLGWCQLRKILEKFQKFS